jgi:hypothetical protein
MSPGADFFALKKAALNTNKKFARFGGDSRPFSMTN